MYVMIVILPIHSFLMSFVVMTPMMLLGCYFITRTETAMYMEFKQYLPEDKQDGIFFSFLEILVPRKFQLLGLASVICCCHYLIQLQTNVLIIEKHKIQKQERQMFEFFKNQKHAILLYRFSDDHNLEVSL